MNTRLTVVRRWSLALAMVLCGFGGNASAILLDRGPDMVYDTALDITWTRQAGDGVLRTWADANSWAANLVFGGFDDWRLPFASVSAGAEFITTLTIGHPCTGAGGADEVACRDNEMAYMFYYNLDGNPFFDMTGNQTAVGGQMLTGIQLLYWSGTPFNLNNAWNFEFFGNQGLGDQCNNLDFPLCGGYAWAVRPGDVGAVSVPEPATLALLGLGLAGLGFARRRKS